MDAICERLISSLNTKYTFFVRQGDPVSEMLFIVRGQLESSTTDGGRVGFFNSIILRPGDFCSEELLVWALLPATSTGPSLNVPEVEAFALRAEDLHFVSGQFQRVHSNRLQQSFRYYFHQWCTCRSRSAATGSGGSAPSWQGLSWARCTATLAIAADIRGLSGDKFGSQGGLSGGGEAGQRQKGVPPLDANILKMPNKIFKPDEPD